MNDVAEICQWLLGHTNAIAVALVGRDGSPIAAAGAESLGDDAIAMALRLAEALDAREDTETFDRDVRSHLHVSLVGERAILAIHFDARSSLGLVRLRAKRARHDLARALAGGPEGGPAPAFAPIGGRARY